MLDKIHSDAAEILICRGLLAQNAEMEKNIGRKIKFFGKWTASRGTVLRDSTFTIVGIQKLFDNSLGYRALCDDYDDMFGHPFRPSEIKFV